MKICQRRNENTCLRSELESKRFDRASFSRGVPLILMEGKDFIVAVVNPQEYYRQNCLPSLLFDRAGRSIPTICAVAVNKEGQY